VSGDFHDVMFNRRLGVLSARVAPAPVIRPMGTTSDGRSSDGEDAMKISRVLLSLLIASLLALFVASPALADEIVLGGSSSGTVTFSSQGSPHNTLGLGWSQLVDTAYFQAPTGSNQDTGTYTIGATSGIVLDLVVPGSGEFNVGSQRFPTTFSYTSATDHDALTGTVEWSSATGVSNFNIAFLVGTLTVDTVSGDSRFTNDFPVNSNHQFDFVLYPGSCNFSPCDLSTLVLQTSGKKFWGPLQQGGVQTPGATEPSTALMLSVAVVAAVLFRKKFSS